MSNLTKNTIYSFLNQIVLVIIPFITFPYISRVLGPEKYGVINFATSIVSIFAVFAGIGLVGYSTREIARKKDNLRDVGKNFQELFIIQLILTAFMMILYTILLFINNTFKSDFLIFFITGLTMLTNLFTFHWFFVGTENFKYITTRDALVKSIFVLLVFTFVKQENDYIVYVLLTLICFILTALLNSLYLLKIIKLKKETIELRRHLKPVFIALLIAFVSTLTIQLNSIFLGSIASKENLGFYNVGVKITTMVVAIVSNAFNVILPRLSYLNSTNDFSSQQKLMGKAGHFLAIISIPLSVGLFIYSKIVIITLFGEQYIQSIRISQITSLGLIIMPLVAILAYYIYSTKNEHISVYIMVISLIINVSASIILIPNYLFIGAAIAFVITESSKLIVYYIVLNKMKIYPNLFSLNYLSYFLVATTTIVLPYIIWKPENFFATTLIVMLSIVLYFTFLVIIKDKYLLMLVKIIRNFQKI